MDVNVTNLIEDPEINRQLRSSPTSPVSPPSPSTSSPREAESPANAPRRPLPPAMTKAEAIAGGECIVIENDDIIRGEDSGYLAPEPGLGDKRNPPPRLQQNAEDRKQNVVQQCRY
eukprot:2429508-Amphidinium_carterae.1